MPFCSACTIVIFFSAWDNSRVKLGNSRNHVLLLLFLYKIQRIFSSSAHHFGEISWSISMNCTILFYLIFLVVDGFGFILGVEILRQWFNRVPTRPILKNLSFCAYITLKTLLHTCMIQIFCGWWPGLIKGLGTFKKAFLKASKDSL